jgi:hypothetical protein
MFHPLPVSPSRGGAISHRCTATGGDNPYAVNVNDLTEIPFPLRGTVSGPIAPHCPPLWRERPGGGGGFTNTERRRRQRRKTAAAGMVASPQGKTLSRSCAETGGKLFPLFCVV